MFRCWTCRKDFQGMTLKTLSKCCGPKFHAGCVEKKTCRRHKDYPLGSPIDCYEIIVRLTKVEKSGDLFK